MSGVMENLRRSLCAHMLNVENMYVIEIVIVQEGLRLCVLKGALCCVW